jgi:hypothetical protein
MNCAIDTQPPTVGGIEDGFCRIIAEAFVQCDQEVRAEIFLKKHRRWWPDKTFDSDEKSGTTIRLGLGFLSGVGKNVGTLYTAVRVKGGPKQQSQRRSYTYCTIL